MQLNYVLLVAGRSYFTQGILLSEGSELCNNINAENWCQCSFKQRQSHVLVTNFTEEYEHLNKGAAIAFLEETQEASDVIAVADFERTPVETFKLPQPFDVNPALPQEQRKKLLALLRRYIAIANVFRRAQNYVRPL